MILVHNIGLLVTNTPSVGEGKIGLIRGAAFLIEGGVISWVGQNSQISQGDVDQKVDALGRCVIPGFVDSHTHLIFAGDRADEFSLRMQGLPYSTGGITATVELTRSASNDQLLASAHRLNQEAISSGTTTIETKSGYGLTLRDELRSLEIAGQITQERTFLGAHVVPTEFKNNPDEYVDLICGQMLDAVAPHAKWIDVFCDRGAFNPDQTRKILAAGIAKGLLPRLHANQLEVGAGVKIGVEFDAASVDHVTHLSDSDISALAKSNTVATLLPAAEFSTRSAYPDARKLIDAGVKVALATDCNPGSSYTTSMPFVIALAVREMKLSPEEALLAATLGGANALRRNDIGYLNVGASADFAILAAPSYIHLAYRPGVSLMEEVWANGVRLR